MGDDPEALIARYRLAYRKANIKDAPTMRYYRGWYRGFDGLCSFAWRKRQIISAIRVLEYRILSPPTGDGHDRS